MLFYISLVVLPLLMGFLSISIFNRGDVPIALGFAGLSLIAWGLIFAGIVPAIATASTGPDNVRWTKPIDGKLSSTINKFGSVDYSFVSDGKSEIIRGTDGAMEDVLVVDSLEQDPHWAYVCDETPDWAAPYTISNCHNYLYIPLD